MTTGSEQDRTLKALQTAIQMEIDGKAYYLKASQQSGNELGKKLLKALAAEEDTHRQAFERIYNAIRKEKDWPKTDFEPDGGRNLRTILARAAGQGGSKAAASELDAVKKAMDMENETYDFYRQQEQAATFDAERKFYQALSAQEKEHSLVLLDYYEYLKDPAAWFVEKEHHSLDGG